VRTEIEEKYKYLFRLYDTDRNMKIDADDLNKVFRLIYAGLNLAEEDYSKLVTETLIRYGNRGEIKMEQFRELVPED
jgi:Ca2+-binding EF-hand superfamily protein